MKKGDVVTIRDSSYSKVITKNKLESSYAGIRSVRGEQGVIIEVSCKFPDLHQYQQDGRTFNNTVIRTDSGKVVFIEERFLELVLPTHKVMIDIEIHDSVIMAGGNVVKISDELYKQIKK